MRHCCPLRRRQPWRAQQGSSLDCSESHHQGGPGTAWWWAGCSPERVDDTSSSMQQVRAAVRCQMSNASSSTDCHGHLKQNGARDAKGDKLCLSGVRTLRRAETHECSTTISREGGSFARARTRYVVGRENRERGCWKELRKSAPAARDECPFSMLRPAAHGGGAKRWTASNVCSWRS